MEPTTEQRVQMAYEFYVTGHFTLDTLIDALNMITRDDERAGHYDGDT